MRTSVVVISLEQVELSLEIARGPERRPVEKLSADRSDQPLDERLRPRHIRHRLDRLDLQDSQVRLPTMELEQRVMIGAQVPRQTAAPVSAPA